MIFSIQFQDFVPGNDGCLGKETSGWNFSNIVFAIPLLDLQAGILPRIALSNCHSYDISRIKHICWSEFFPVWTGDWIAVFIKFLAICSRTRVGLFTKCVELVCSGKFFLLHVKDFPAIFAKIISFLVWMRIYIFMATTFTIAMVLFRQNASTLLADSISLVIWFGIDRNMATIRTFIRYFTFFFRLYHIFLGNDMSTFLTYQIPIFVSF
mmetsp:Transcript_24670/g.43776  ORF Transcript_24670/g.43776 Transcript_24670/m.43776 type:complete len:210 (+) Transcript_24670:307-936(+)